MISTYTYIYIFSVTDVAHLNLTSSETNETDRDIAKSGNDTLQQQPGSRHTRQQAEEEFNVNMYPESGYTYQKPEIPFETGNLDNGGYKYPKPVNPMTYPPPQSSTTTDQSFPDATARYRLK